MGQVTTDSQNPGRRQSQEYSAGGGISTSKAPALTQAIDCLILKNAVIDRRIGAIVKRPGSKTEVISGTLGFPNGIGEYESPAAGGTMSTNRTLFAAFGGTQFRYQQLGSWTSATATAFVNLDTSKQYQFKKLGTNMFIAGGQMAKWGGPGKQVDRVGIVPPTGVPERPTVVTKNLPGPGLTWTVGGGATYMLTFFDSATGLESDWGFKYFSPGPITDNAVELSIEPITPKNWDTLKLYRTFDGGTIPYLVASLPAGTTSYIDRTPDSQLTQISAPEFSRLPPPDSIYVMEKFAQRIWGVDARNPYKLVYSEPYTGSDVDLEYYPVDNYVMLNEPITHLHRAPGKLLVFHPRSISYISGGSSIDFTSNPWSPGVGTVFPFSVSDNGSEIVFLAEQGFVSIPFSGGAPRHISREIDDILQPVLAASYNSSLYVSAAWSTSLRQFVFSIGAQSTAGAPWEEVGTGSTADAVAGWEDTSTLVTETWEDPSNPSPGASMKVRFFGYSPELSNPGSGEHRWMEYEFPNVLNDNITGSYPVYLMHPRPGSDTSDPQQDKTYASIWRGTYGEIRSLFRRDVATDDGAAITAEILTGRIKPGIPGAGYKLFHGIGFDNTYLDPTFDGNATLKYLVDFDDAQIRNYAPQLITIAAQSSRDIKKLTTTLARHIHLHVTDTSQSPNKILLANFHVHFRERLRRQGR